MAGSGFTYQQFKCDVEHVNFLYQFMDSTYRDENCKVLESQQVFEVRAIESHTSNLGHIWKGYFYAPESGTYTFRVQAMEGVTFRISNAFGSA